MKENIPVFALLTVRHDWIRLWRAGSLAVGSQTLRSRVAVVLVVFVPFSPLNFFSPEFYSVYDKMNKKTNFCPDCNKVIINYFSVYVALYLPSGVRMTSGVWLGVPIPVVTSRLARPDAANAKKNMYEIVKQRKNSSMGDSDFFTFI